MTRVLAALAILLGSPVHTQAADVALSGILGKKALLVIDGGPPRAVAVNGTTPEGVKLLSVSRETSSAVVESDGIVYKLRLGEGPIGTAPTSTPGEQTTLTLFADGRGHHYADGSINGTSLRFIVDTGATTIALGLNDAKRARINLERATPVAMQTASGLVKAWKVHLDIVKVGPLVLHGVEATVMENDLPIALLGMSFLRRTQMDREGDRLTLRKRF